MTNAHTAQAATREVAYSIEIDVPIERVWRALTEAEELERWLPLKARVEAGPGGEIWMSWDNEPRAHRRLSDEIRRAICARRGTRRR